MVARFLKTNMGVANQKSLRTPALADNCASRWERVFKFDKLCKSWKYVKVCKGWENGEKFIKYTKVKERMQ